MATIPVLTQTILGAAAVTAVHTVAAAKIDTVRVMVTNRASATVTYRLFIAPLGATHSDDQAYVWDETVSAPGSGTSPPIVLATTDVIRAYANIAGLRITVTGISQDV